MNQFEGLLKFDTDMVEKLSELSTYEILNFIYQNVRDYPNSMEVNVGVISWVINLNMWKQDFNQVREIFRLIDCNKINSDVAVGLLRSAYVFKHFVKDDFNKVLNYFHDGSEKTERLFHGLDRFNTN